MVEGGLEGGKPKGGFAEALRWGGLRWKLGTGNWGQGTGGSELGTGNWDRELGTGNWGQGPGGREVETGGVVFGRFQSPKAEKTISDAIFPGLSACNKIIFLQAPAEDNEGGLGGGLTGVLKGA